MKVDVEIKLTKDFITACQIYNITLEDALMCYVDNITVYNSFAALHDNHESLGSKIFFRDYCCPLINDPKRNVEYAHHESTKNATLDILKLIVQGKTSRSRKYKAVIKEWIDGLKLHFGSGKVYFHEKLTNKHPAATNSGKSAVRTLNLTVSNDFILMCHFAGFSPSHALQFFVDNLSLPKFLSGHRDSTYSAVTFFFFLNIKTPYSNEIINEINKRSSKCYEKELTSYLDEPPPLRRKDLEKKIRGEVDEWRNEYVGIRSQLTNEGYKISEVRY